MNPNNNGKTIKLIFIGLFIIYICLYSVKYTGYYSGNLSREVRFTNEQIKKFEEDIKNGKTLDVDGYLQEKNKNYSNKFSKFGYSFSTNINKTFTTGITEISKIFKKLVT